MFSGAVGLQLPLSEPVPKLRKSASAPWRFANYGRGSVQVAHSTEPRALASGLRGSRSWRPHRLPRQPAKSPHAARELLQRCFQIVCVEIRPQHGSEIEFRVSGFPQQEVAEPLLARSSDQQVALALGPAAIAI